MALEILDKYFRITHEARHDLESFYWLLVWIVLRHTEHECYWTWHELFDCSTSTRARDVKRSWLTYPDRCIKVIGNEPLTNLLENFRKLCQNNAYMERPEERMTHNRVLRLFSIALKDRKQWPRTAVDHARPWVMPDTRPSDNPQPHNQLRSKGTLAFSSTAPDEHEPPPGVAPDDVLRTFRGTTDAAPSRTAEVPDEQIDPEANTDMEEAPTGKGKGKAPARKAVARRPDRPRARVVAPKTSDATSQASGSREAPPSSDGASTSRGNGSAQARYGPRGAMKETARSSGRSTTRSMGPPPVPATCSSHSRGRASSRLATAQRSPKRNRATKRSRSREDEVAEVQRSGAGSSHSPKRQRTLSQPGPVSPKGSRKAKGKKKA